MDGLNEYIHTALELGFTAAAPFDTSRLICRPDIRMLYAPDKCTSYGTNWICPPGSGELPDRAAWLAKYSRGLLVQSKTEKIDTNDFQLLKKLAATHNQRLLRLNEIISEKYPDAFLLSTGGCELCEKCTYPDKPLPQAGAFARLAFRPWHRRQRPVRLRRNGVLFHTGDSVLCGLYPCLSKRNFTLRTD